MVDLEISYSSSFKKQFSKIKDKSLKSKILKETKKIIDNPYVGKPMRNLRKETREVYIKPFSLSL